MSLKIIFAGTPDFASRHLLSLLDSEHEIVAVYTQPDRPAGRGKKLQASPVKQLASDNGIDVFQPENFKSAEDQAQLAELNADIMVVVAYGLLLPESILNTPKLGCINVHGSILPKWRGAAPIQRSIWAGDEKTGVTIMQMDVGLDTGDMLHINETPILASDTSASLYEKLAETGPIALVDCLQKISSGDITAVKQDDDLACYAKKLSKEEALINWQDDAVFIERCIRAFNPWPCSFFCIEDEKGKTQTIKAWQAEVVDEESGKEAGTIVSADKSGIKVQTGKACLLLQQIQVPGKKPNLVSDVLNSKKTWFEESSIIGVK